MAEDKAACSSGNAGVLGLSLLLGDSRNKNNESESEDQQMVKCFPLAGLN